MDKFMVLVRGKNFILWSKEAKRDEQFGFLTARYVEAASPEEAQETAIELIREELGEHVKNEKDNPPLMYIDEITGLTDFGELQVPGKGFAFYSEEEKPQAEPEHGIEG